MKKLIYFILINMIFTFVLLAQDVVVVTPPSDFIGLKANNIKSIIEQNTQQLNLGNNFVKVFYTKVNNKFIVVKQSRFSYTVSYVLITIDGKSINILETNYIPQIDDFEIYEIGTGLNKVESINVDFLFDTECDYFPTAVNAINTVANYATNQSFNVLKLLGSSATTGAIQSAINNNDLVAMGNVGHGCSTGIQLRNGSISHTWFAAQDLRGEVYYFNSCEVYNQPFVSSMLNSGGARTYIGGVIDLPVGPSEEVFMDFWDDAISGNAEMGEALIEGEYNYSLLGYHGIGGDDGVLKLTTTGTLNRNEVWLGEINVVGNVSVPTGKTLTIKTGATINLNGNSIISTGGIIVKENGATVNGATIVVKSGSNYKGIFPTSTTIQGVINWMSSDWKIELASGTYNETLTISKDIEIEGENESTVIINGDITFSNTSQADLSYVTVSGIIEVNSGSYNSIRFVTTDERILWNSSNNGYIASVTANHTDKYSAKVYNSSYVTINNFESTSSSKYGIYGSSSSSLDMVALSLEEKTFAIQTTSSTSGTIYIGNFVDNDYDVWDAGSGVGYYLCFWSDNPPNLYGYVYYNPPSSQSSSSNLAKIENNGQAIKAVDNINSNISDDADFNEALNIFRMIKDKKRLARENEEKFEPSDYLADYNDAIDKFKKVVQKLNSEKLAISSQLYLYFLYLDIQQNTEFISYLESVINNCENENLKHRSMILLAYTQIREGEYKTATEYIDNVIQEADDEDILANSLYDNGMILKYFLKDENEAKKYFSTLVESYPKNILADHASDELEDRNIEDNPEKNELVNKLEISNYPNPFNPTTQISYQIPKDGLVNLVVYNTLGQVVTELVNEHQTIGKYSVQFNASNLPSGVYFYKLQAGEFNKVNKMLLLK